MSERSTSRRGFLKSIALGAAALSSSGILTRCSRRKSPNIIFFIADDMRPEMCNFLPEGKGKNLTPNIDRLAAEGTLMRGQNVVSPVCTPSRVNCLTGRYAGRARNASFLARTKKEEGQTVVEWNAFITAGDNILPRYLNSVGYVTGMVGKNHAIEARGFKKFPSYHDNPLDPAIDAIVKYNYSKVRGAILDAGFDYAEAIYHNNPNFIGLRRLAVHNLDWIAKAGVDFIEQNKEKPFFLYFATTVPHDPNEPDRSWNADRRITANGFLDKPADVLPPSETIPARLQKAGLADRGKENVLYLDDALGALMQKLQELNLMHNTLIFFFNDHGQNSKGTLYQGGVHDPSLIWRRGGFSCGKSCDALVSNIDFAPTILDYAGVVYSASDFDGVSIKPLLDGKTDRVHNSLYYELGYARGVRKGDWKYIAIRYPSYLEKMPLEQRAARLKAYNEHRKSMDLPIVNTDPTKPYSHLTPIAGGGHAEHESYGNFPGYFDPDQLYNLADDPGEQTNLANDPKYAGKLDDMKKELQKYLDTLPGTFRL